MKYKVIRIVDEDGNDFYAVERKGIYGFNRTTIGSKKFSTYEEAERYAAELDNEE